MKLRMFEAFVAQRDYRFEPAIIDPILGLIRDNIDFLCEEDNLPQLAKLGYMYNSLWYAGRICWGYEGILRPGKLTYADEYDDDNTYGDCEDNPKYKIEMCYDNDDEHEDLIYDAWGMHITGTDNTIPTFEAFSKMINEGKELTVAEKKLLKRDKTFDEWVEILTDDSYRYKSIYPDRRSVLNHLLCVSGTGYSMDANGFIIQEASGADQDQAVYGDWQNCKFTGDIKTEVDRLLSLVELKETLNAAHAYINKASNERHLKDYAFFYKMLKSEGIHDVDKDGPLPVDKIHQALDMMNGELAALKGKKKDKPVEKYKEYYPLSKYSLAYKISDTESLNRMGVKKVHKSYIDACVEICRDIISHDAQEKESNVKTAKTILGNLKTDGYENSKGMDKYAVLEEIKEIFVDISDTYHVGITLNDSAQSEYNDNNYRIHIRLDSSYPKEGTFLLDDLKSTQIYAPLSSAIDRVSDIDGIKYIQFYYDYKGNAGEISIEAGVGSDKYPKEQYESNLDFKEQGFNVSQNALVFKSTNLGMVFKFQKVEPLGSDHPHSKNSTHKKYFSLNKPMEVYDMNNHLKATFRIDERNINIIICSNSDDDFKDKADWIVKQYYILRESDPAYGKYDINTREGAEGKRCLYAHDFVVWLDKQKMDL